MLPSPLAIVDVETTGMTATVDRITEIGILTVVDGRVVDEWATLINPQCAVPAEIQWLTGITDAMLRDAPRFAEIASQVHARLTGHIFVAHNARFDYGFIKNEFRRLGIAFTADVLCTVRLSRRLYPEHRSHSLDALRDRHLLSSAGRHRALGDARAAWQFIETARCEKSPLELATAIKTILRMPSLPPQLAAGALDDLPEGPGVYTFYGVNDLPIYIGKAKDIRARVRSHFSSDHRSANDLRLSSEVTRISFEETAGELGALLREARLVKQLLPLRNQRLRRNLALVFIRLNADSHAITYLPGSAVDFAASESLYGPFATKASAKAYLLKLATAHLLCWHVLSASKAVGPCFARQLQRCRGACIGVEDKSVHLLRLAAALVDQRLRAWPAAGPVGIREQHPEGWAALHIFDRWRYLGSALNENAMHEILAARCEDAFDADVYKLLVRYLDQGGKWVALPPRSGVTKIAAARDAEVGNRLETQ